MTDERDPIMEAKVRLQARLETLPGWQLVKPVDYSTDLELYREVYNVWENNWDATDPRYYHLETSETFLLRRWMEFDTLAHIFHYGPKGSGKNRALDIHQALAPNPIMVSGPSVNAIYQVVDMLHPTLLMDECDRLGKAKESGDYVLAMLEILNVYKKGTVTIRGTQEGVVRVYDLFCPKLLAGTVGLPGTLPDRVIQVDCERNMKDIPLDLAIPDTLKGKLCRYSGKHEEYNGITRDQFRTLIGDNRVTQLYYPLYQVCPDPLGQKAILDMAKERVDEREQEEAYGESAQVLEQIVKRVEEQANATVATVLSVVGQVPFYIDLDSLVNDCKDFVPKSVKDPNKWLGWQLKKLQFTREREGHTNIRKAKIPVTVLAKKIRRYAPSLLRDEK